jgi:hypothetical protein
MLDEEHLRMGARRLTERAHPCAKRARQRDLGECAFGIEAMSSVIGLGYGWHHISHQPFPLLAAKRHQG